MDDSKPVRDERVETFVLIFDVAEHRCTICPEHGTVHGTSNSFLSILSSLTARVAALNSSQGTYSDLRGAKRDLDMTNEQ